MASARLRQYSHKEIQRAVTRDHFLSTQPQARRWRPARMIYPSSSTRPSAQTPITTLTERSHHVSNQQPWYAAAATSSRYVSSALELWKLEPIYSRNPVLLSSLSKSRLETPQEDMQRRAFQRNLEAALHH
ncbi:hypothetical protein ACJQWK_02395 [Exserohilum turcicum]